MSSNTSKEHIIPQFMGKFDQNPTIKICKKCNNEVFSRLEENYKEDTPEGILFRILNLSNDYLIKVRNNNASYSVISDEIGTNLSTEMFPFLNYNLERIPVSQIKLKKGNCDIIIIPEKISKGKKRQDSIDNLVKLCKNADHKTIRIFYEEKRFGDAISLLKEIEIYSAESIKPQPFVLSDVGKALEFRRNKLISYDIGRVISKIAFNYFAYCVIEDGRRELLFHPYFNEIKRYILGITPIINFVSTIPHMKVQDKNLNNAGNNDKVGLLGYTICFNREFDMMRDCDLIIAQVSLLGFGNCRIPIGRIPNELRKRGFGSAHLFNPYNKKYFTLSKNNTGTAINKNKFGLFNAFHS